MKLRVVGEKIAEVLDRPGWAWFAGRMHLTRPGLARSLVGATTRGNAWNKQPSYS